MRMIDLSMMYFLGSFFLYYNNSGIQLVYGYMMFIM